MAGYRFDLFLAVVTSIIQIPVIHSWSGYPYLTAFQLMRIHRVIVGIKPIGELVVRGPMRAWQQPGRGCKVAGLQSGRAAKWPGCKVAGLRSGL